LSGLKVLENWSRLYPDQSHTASQFAFKKIRFEGGHDIATYTDWLLRMGGLVKAYCADWIGIVIYWSKDGKAHRIFTVTHLLGSLLNEV